MTPTTHHPDWQIKKLGDLFDIKSSKRVHKVDWRTKGIPFYRAREVVKLSKNGYVNNELFISPELYEKFTKEKGGPKEGDIVISAVGTLGQCYLVKKNDKFYFKDASVLWFAKVAEVNSEYIEYLFKSDCVLSQVMHKSMGATVGTLTIDRAKNIQIPLPPLSEQKRIVKILDDTFAAAERAREIAEQNFASAKELFESYLQGVFAGGGDDWEEKNLGDVCETGAGGTPLKSQKDYYEGGDIPWLRSGEVCKKDIFESKLFITEKGLQNSSAKLFPPCTVLIAMYGATAGQVGILRFESSTNQAVCGVLPSEEFLPEFIYYFFSAKKEDLVKQAVGGAQPNISQVKIKNTKIPVLGLKTQKQIVAKLDQLSAETRKLEDIYQQKCDNIDELKKSILGKAFAGEL